jgi:ketosteroid isomerase-like protein
MRDPIWRQGPVGYCSSYFFSRDFKKEDSMKSIAHAVGLMLLFFALPVQAQNVAGTQVTDAQRSEIEKILTEANQELLASTNQLSTAGHAKYFSESFQEQVNSGNIVATSKEASLKTIGNWFNQRTSQTFSNSTFKIFVLSPELAYVLTVGGGSVAMKNGRKAGFGNAITSIWRKESGGWKIIHVHESSW